MKKYFFIAVFFLTLFAACTKDVPDAAACFSVDVTETTDSTHLFMFHNCSEEFQSLRWDFGDGNFSEDENPAHIYNAHGSFTVRMTAMNDEGETSSAQAAVVVGYYEIEKIVFRKTWASFAPPKFVAVNYSFFPVYDTLFSLADLPLTVLPDANSTFTLQEQSTPLLYAETDYTGNGGDRIFDLTISSVIDRKADVDVMFPPADTAKFTLYFRIVAQ